MISDKLTNYSNYKGINERLYRALEHAAHNDFSKSVPGRNEVDGDDIYYNFINEGDLVPLDKNTYEAHRVYVDIHVDVNGGEKVYVSDISEMSVTKEYDAEGDYLLADGKPQSVVTLKAGYFCVCLPNDVHMPMVPDGEHSKITKAIYKVRL